MNTNQNIWSAAESAQARLLWSRGESAERISQVTGRSRNAVIGYLSRWQKSRREPIPHPRAQVPWNKGLRTAPVRNRRTVASRSPVRRPRPPVSPGSPLPYLLLNRAIAWHAPDGCTWIDGPSFPPSFCNCTCVPGSSWCVFHFRMAHTRAAPQPEGVLSRRGALTAEWR